MRGKPFQHGQKKPRNSGRKKGSTNKVSPAQRAAARQLLASESYRRSLLKRLREGKAGKLEPLLWHYAYGKPGRQGRRRSSSGTQQG